MGKKKRGRGAPRKHTPDPDTLAGRVAINLRSLREARGWTVDEASEACDISRATWYRLEEGERQKVNVSDWVDRLAEHLEIDISRLTRKPRAKKPSDRKKSD